MYLSAFRSQLTVIATYPPRDTVILFFPINSKLAKLFYNYEGKKKKDADDELFGRLLKPWDLRECPFTYRGNKVGGPVRVCQLTQ